MDKEACLDPSHAFQNYDTLAQCFHLWTDEPSTTPTSGSSLPENNTFGDVLQRCISSYCDSPSSDLGGCGHRPRSLGRPYQLLSQPILSFQAAECNGINQHANTDIAGPGVCRCFLAVSQDLEVWNYAMAL